MSAFIASPQRVLGTFCAVQTKPPSPLRHFKHRLDVSFVIHALRTPSDSYSTSRLNGFWTSVSQTSILPLCSCAGRQPAPVPQLVPALPHAAPRRRGGSLRGREEHRRRGGGPAAEAGLLDPLPTVSGYGKDVAVDPRIRSIKLDNQWLFDSE